MIAEGANFDVKGYRFQAEKEDLRKPRVVRVSLDLRSYQLY